MHLTRRHIRFIAAAASTTMAVIDFLIGLRVLDIGGSTTPDQVDIGLFGASAGSVFLVLALLLALTDRRWLWVPAVVFQVFVYAVYIGTSSVRVPPFETWGITLRIIQIPLLLGLVYLSIRAPSSTRPSIGRDNAAIDRHLPMGA